MVSGIVFFFVFLTSSAERRFGGNDHFEYLLFLSFMELSPAISQCKFVVASYPSLKTYLYKKIQGQKESFRAGGTAERETNESARARVIEEKFLYKIENRYT